MKTWIIQKKTRHYFRGIIETGTIFNKVGFKKLGTTFQNISDKSGKQNLIFIQIFYYNNSKAPFDFSTKMQIPFYFVQEDIPQRYSFWNICFQALPYVYISVSQKKRHKKVQKTNQNPTKNLNLLSLCCFYSIYYAFCIILISNWGWFPVFSLI